MSSESTESKLRKLNENTEELERMMQKHQPTFNSTFLDPSEKDKGENPIDEELKEVLLKMSEVLHRNTDVLQSNTTELKELKETIAFFARSFLSDWMSEIKLNVNELAEAKTPEEAKIIQETILELSSLDMTQQIGDAYSGDKQMEQKFQGMLDSLYKDIETDMQTAINSEANNTRSLGRYLSDRFNKIEDMLSDVKSVSATTSDMVDSIPRTYQ